MKFKNITFKKLGKLICGDEGPAPYLSGSMLIEFFNELGFDDVYENFPTRYIYAENKVRVLTDEGRFISVVEELLAPIRYIDIEQTSDEVLEYLNTILITEGYKVIAGSRNGKYSLLNINTNTITVKKEELNILSSEFLREQIDKCNRKIVEGDLYGAITNSRSMVEEVLLAIEEDITGKRGKNTGDMSALYKRVAKLINFDSGKEGLATPLRQILTGLNSIVIGVANLRTKASDSHAAEYKPEKHHAEVAVNCAMTFTSFVLKSYNYQKSLK